MSKEIIYAEDEKVIRKYKVFEAKGSNPDKRGVELTVTNKRVIEKTFQKGLLSNSVNYREVLIENISGDIYTAINRKVSLFKVVLFIILAMVFFTLGGTIGIILGIFMLVMVILAFVFPTTEGKIEILNKGVTYEGISTLGGKIIKNKRTGVGILDVREGKSFSLMQREIGYLISEIKKGTDLEKLMENMKVKTTKSINLYSQPYKEDNRYYQNNNDYGYQSNNNDDDDDEIPLI